ncbi:LysE family translocator [Nocardioides ferulae]|uniref:LysE family translocator n=1 Tax=Nocardioides ferulae TaxID=2340821 RepID=UPI000EAC5D40|nr:LysE family translocator [Nocardioides ferulae]
MTLGTAGAFWAVSFLFVITPGADWAYAMSAGLRYRTVLPAIGGLLAGHLAATVVVAAGVAAILSRSPVLMTALTVSGAAYLVWLGVGVLTAGAAPFVASDATPEVSWARQAVAGFGVSGLNPKVLLLFLALLPQFVDAAASWPVPAQIFTLGLVHMASCAVVYSVVGMGARRLLSARPAAARTVSRLSGVAMMMIGGLIVAKQLLT